MRACFVLHTDMFRPSPIFRAVKEALALGKRGVDCSAVCWIKRPAPLPAHETLEGVSVQRLFIQPPPQRPTQIIRRYAILRGVTRNLAQRAIDEKPNLIIPHDLEVLSAGLRAGRHLGVPVLYDAHEDWPAMVGESSRLEGFFSAILERRLCRHVAGVVTPSDMITEKFRDWGVPAATLHNAPYRAEVDPLPDERAILRTRERLGVANRFVVGYVGTLAPNRGLETVIDALRGLPSDIAFVVVGGPEEESRRLTYLAQTYGVSDRVRLVGRVERTEVSAITAAFDVAVALPPPISRNYLTTLPNKAYDYMAAGVPILASDLPALRRLVTDEAHCGVVVSPDASAVQRALRELMGDPARLRALGRSGRNAFVERYAWEHQEQVFFRMLQDVGVGLEESTKPTRAEARR